MIRGKIHEESGKQYCFVEVEIESDNEDTFISDYLRVLGKLRLGHLSMLENAIESSITASEKQLETLRRALKQKNKSTSDLLDYIKKTRPLKLEDITKEEASMALDLLLKKEGEKNE